MAVDNEDPDISPPSPLAKNLSGPDCGEITRLYCNSIPEVHVIKFLGVFFQSDAKFDNHLTSVVKKANRNLYFVKLLWLNKAPSSAIWQAYLSLVFSTFSYCWPALCDLPSSFFSKFCSIEKKACKWAGVSFSQSALRSRLDGICLRLVRNVSNFHLSHPLAEFFCCSSSNPRS